MANRKTFRALGLKADLVRDWRRRNLLNGIGRSVRGRWRYSDRDLIILRLVSLLSWFGIGPTSSAPVAKKVAATDLTREWLMIGPNDSLHYADDFESLIAERNQRRYLVAILLPLGRLVREVRGHG